MSFCFFPFLSVSVRFGIGATIRTHREIQCLPYAGYFYDVLEWPLLELSQEILEEGVEVEGGEVCVEEGKDDPVGVAEAGHQAGHLPLQGTTTYQLKV